VNLLGNMLTAAALGAFLVFAFTVMALAFINFWPECRGGLRVRSVTRFLAGAAICGLVGALFMQAFGLWIT